MLVVGGGGGLPRVIHTLYNMASQARFSGLCLYFSADEECILIGLVWIVKWIK